MADERRTVRSGLPATLGSELETLVSTLIPAPFHAGRTQGRYRIERVLGRGALFVTFATTRIDDEGAVPFVLKVLRPSLARAWPDGIRVLSREQAKIMAILNERVPPSPHVVRLLEVSELAIDVSRGVDVPVPWLALELIEGAADGRGGITLFDRVRDAVTKTGVSLSPAVTCALLHGIALGLDWVHSHGLLHRGLSPSNVLITAAPGRPLVAKITDVGIARPAGLPSNFGLAPGRDERIPMLSSTPYVAPEQHQRKALGPGTDVFAFAQVARFLLTGHGPSPGDPALLDAPALHPSFRTSTDAVEAMDAFLQSATRHDPDERPHTILSLWGELEPLLHAAQGEPDAARSFPPVDATPWFWSERHRPRTPLQLSSVAPDEEGQALAITAHGAAQRLVYFDGRGYRALGAAPLLRSLRGLSAFATRKWLVFGDGTRCERLDSEGWHEVVRSDSHRVVEFAAASDERTNGFIALVTALPNEPPTLLLAVDGAWRPPVRLDGASRISGICRLDASSSGGGLVLIGTSLHGGPYVAACDESSGQVRPQRTTSRGALLSIASDAHGTAYAVGAHGTAMTIRRFADQTLRLTCTAEAVGTMDDLRAIALGVNTVAWCASSSTIYRRNPGGAWSSAFHDPDIGSPFCALASRPSGLFAFTSGGVVLEGRSLGAGNRV